MENFFSEIRDYGHRNNNPSAYQFGASFKTLLCRNLTSKKSLSSNCEENEEGISLALSNMFRAAEVVSFNEEKNTNVEYYDSAIPETRNTILKLDTQKIIKNIKRNIAVAQCPECAEYLDGDRVLEEIEQKIEFAEKRFPYICYVRKVKEKLRQIFDAEQKLANNMNCLTLQRALK